MNANDLDKQIELLKNGELLRENDIKILCARAREIFIEESNVQRIDCPVTICGDIHGQFYDLLELFKLGGNCPDVNYLFLGDFVNRGHHSIESILLLYALKVKYPDRITLLRGNHESRVVTQVFGLYDECLRKYGSLNVWRYITETFEYLSLSALVDDSIFCTHGGIASDIKSLDDIRCLDRVKEIPSQGEMCELLWNDPEEESSGFKDNSRGYKIVANELNVIIFSQNRTGKTFGQDVFRQFLNTNNLTKMVRAHQLVMEGYRSIWENNSCTTVWSAPNYCYRCGNLASVMEIKQANQPAVFKTFDAVSEQLKGAGQKVTSNIPDYFL